MKRFFLPVLVIFCCVGMLKTARADVRLPAIIGTHMVLQQSSEVCIWGWSDPGEKIMINTNWDTTTYRATATGDAKWKILIKTPKAGGPFIITIKGNNTIVLNDVMTGEVWACSGQSNMEMSYNWGLKKYTSDVENATNQHIRFFQTKKQTADYPQNDAEGTWIVCNPNDAKNFSMAGYFFGRQLQQTLNVPVGLINSSWGGTPAEVWTPRDTLEMQPVLKDAAAGLKPSGGWPTKVSVAYNAMIYPLTNYSIAGVLWYQGESNVGSPASYSQLLKTMIVSWRKAWKKDLPFYFVQIAPYAGYGKGMSSALIREAQTKALALPNTGMVVIHDLVDDINDIHPKNKKDVGLRLANYALANIYGKKELPFKSLTYQSMTIEKDKIMISFDQAAKGLMSKGDTLTGFYIAGADKIFVPALAKIQGNTIVVSNKKVPEPVAVRFGFTNSSMPNLFSKDGLPVNIFRTDDWDVFTENVN